MGWWRLVRQVVREALTSRPRARATSPVVGPAETRPQARAAACVSAARQALLSGDVETGAEAAAQALRHDPRDLLAAFYLGQAHLRAGRLGAARRAFELARDHGDPFGLASAWLARLAPGEPEVQPVRAPHVAAAIELERAARAALRRSEADTARDLARRAVATDPENLLAHHLLGRALLALGERAAARAAFDAARAHDTGLGVVAGWQEDEPGLPAVTWDDEEEP